MSAINALRLGLALTVAAASVPLVDHATGDVLAAHIRAGYPAYSAGRVDTAAKTYIMILVAVGVLGVAGWLGTIRAVRARRRWAPLAATALWAVAASAALYGLLARDTSGATGLPPLLGWTGLAPVAAGLVAVTRLWRAGTGSTTIDQ